MPGFSFYRNRSNRPKFNGPTNPWYKGPLTKNRLADLRCKLADARGMLLDICYRIRTGDPIDVDELDELEEIIRDTADP